MATLPGTYVRTGLSANVRINALVDVMLAGNLVEFRQIMIYHERGTRIGNGIYRFTYQNWNPDFTPQIFLNNNPTQLADGLRTLNSLMGTVTIPSAATTADNVMATYNFDYFPIYALEGFMYRSVDVINVGAQGPVTNYTIDNAPSNWDSLICDFAFAMCMEKLILDYDLWKGRLVFAIGPQNLMDGGGDVISALETLKNNAEERANRALDNPLLKATPYVAKPTQYYYESLLVGSSGRSGAHGGADFGKLRGWKINKYLGRTL